MNHHVLSCIINYVPEHMGIIMYYHVLSCVINIYKLCMCVLMVCFLLDSWTINQPTVQVYWTRAVNVDGRRTFQGGKHLAESAVWPEEFCLAILRCWEAAR